MDRHEAVRIGASLNALRPDWPAAQIVTLIEAKLATRAARDVHLALVYLAYDPATKSPYRVIEGGPWWQTTRPTGPATPTVREHPCPDHPQHRSWACPECASDFAPMPDSVRTLLDEVRKRPRPVIPARGQPLPDENTPTHTRVTPDTPDPAKRRTAARAS